MDVCTDCFMGDDQENKTGKRLERRSDADRRQDSERRGPLRWDPKNMERRNGEDRRRPGYLSDNDIPDQDDK